MNLTTARANRALDSQPFKGLGKTTLFFCKQLPGKKQATIVPCACSQPRWLISLARLPNPNVSQALFFFSATATVLRTTNDPDWIFAAVVLVLVVFFVG